MILEMAMVHPHPRANAIPCYHQEAEALAGGQYMVVLKATVGVRRGKGVRVGRAIGVEPAMTVQVERMHTVAVGHHNPLDQLALARSVRGSVRVLASVE